MIDLFAALWPYALTIGLAVAVLIAAWFVAYGPDERPISPVDRAYADARRITAHPTRPEDDCPDTAYEPADTTHHGYTARRPR